MATLSVCLGLWSVIGVGCSVPPCEEAEACCEVTESLLLALGMNANQVTSTCQGLEEANDDQCTTITDELQMTLSEWGLRVPEDCI